MQMLKPWSKVIKVQIHFNLKSKPKFQIKNQAHTSPWSNAHLSSVKQTVKVTSFFSFPAFTHHIKTLHHHYPCYTPSSPQYLKSYLPLSHSPNPHNPYLTPFPGQQSIRLLLGAIIQSRAVTAPRLING